MENPQAVRLPYLTEARAERTGIKKIGVAIVIVDLTTGKIWSVIEREKKESTGRKPNTVSFPLETRKRGESIADNVVGGLSEFRPLADGEELVWLEGGSYKGRYELIKEKGVIADLVFLGLKNRQPETNTDMNCPEVAVGGWMDLDEFLGLENLRDGVGAFLITIKAEGWIRDFMEKVKTVRSRRWILSDNKELVRLLQERERLTDYGESDKH